MSYNPPSDATVPPWLKDSTNEAQAGWDKYGIPPIGDPTQPAPGPVVGDGLAEKHRWWNIFIYTDPRTEEVRYVEWSTLEPERRLKAEYVALDYSQDPEPRPLHLWLDELILADCEPTIQVLEKVHYRDRVERMTYHIATLKAGGAKLLNMSTDGFENDSYDLWLAERHIKEL